MMSAVMKMMEALQRCSALSPRSCLCHLAPEAATRRHSAEQSRMSFAVRVARGCAPRVTRVRATTSDFVARGGVALLPPGYRAAAPCCWCCAAWALRRAGRRLIIV